MSDTVKRALDLVSGYQDPTSQKMQGFDWRPLRDVQEDLGGMKEIPGHVEDFGAYMDEMARKAATSGLSPRDLIKAYAITRSSIQRRSQTADKVRAAGLDLHPSVTGSIRPEGAMAEWLKSKMGQRYLDAAEIGKVDPEAVAHAQSVMKPFGLNAETDALPWAAENLHDKHKVVSDMVKRAVSSNSPVAEWREFGKGLRGIGTAKAGFVASMLGRGDQPTLDARQVVLQTGMPTSAAKSPMRRAGFEAVDRLAARQTALNPKMDAGLEPFRQHLTHHAIWDKAGNEQTTHSDVIDAMRHANAGGRVGKQFGGPMGDDHFGKVIARLKDHPLGAQLLKVIGVDPKFSDEQAQKYLQAMEQRKTRIVDPGEIWKINDPVERARQIAILNLNKVDVSSNKPTRGGYYKINQSVAPQDVQSTVSQIPGVTTAQRNKMSWEDALTPMAGGTLIGLGGDRSRLGRMTHIQGKKLEWPVDLHAGSDYMLEPNQRRVWANAPLHAKALAKMIGKAAEKGPIIGAFQPMGPQSVSSSHNMVDALMAQIKSSNIDPKDAQAFDEALKRGEHAPTKGKRAAFAKAMENWPGIMNSKAASDFMRPETGFAGTHRAGFTSMMDTAKWNRLGFPEVGVTRAAISEPELLGASNAMVGHRLVKLDPDQLMKNATNLALGKHSTYQADTEGEYHGDVPLIPRRAAFTDYADALTGKEIKGNLPVHSLSEEPLGRSTDRKMYEEQKPWGAINQRMLDSTALAEQNIGRIGHKAGGAVQPSDAQKEAGNYRKEHISFQGLPISLENRKGSTRSGTGPDGRKWSVKLPYDYGYIKRTEGADGDHVDVCIGPDHQSDHVFVVDQHDHRTGKFDEHKVLLGYRTKQDAERAYVNGFSDGKGRDRMKSMVAMPMAQFKLWLKRGNTKKPIERALKMTSLYSLGHDRDAG
jgi:hypothetical protein